MKKSIILLVAFVLLSCKNKPENNSPHKVLTGEKIPVEYAEGFELIEYDGFKLLTIRNSWPKAEKNFVYLLAEKNAEIPKNLEYDERINIPVNKIVVTSTTHIPSLEALDEINSLVGFPGLDYISSEKTRERIEVGKIKELGANENLNTEILLELAPNVVVGFAINGSNKAFNTLRKSGIPVVYNSDWMEKKPLGKAEWIKFFGAFFDKIPEAIAIFEQIEKDYREAKKLAESVNEKPSVLAGSMFKDQWYVPYGNSWQANFIEDAGGNYIYENIHGNGSMSISFEQVFANAADADFWIAPGSFVSYEQLLESSEHYQKFEAFQNKKIYTYAKTKGETGGVLYYELAPSRPDLVLKDLIKVFHPDLLPDYKTVFFKPLNP